MTPEPIAYREDDDGWIYHYPGGDGVFEHIRDHMKSQIGKTIFPVYGEETLILDWIEACASAGRLEIARSILGSGFEFGFHTDGKPSSCVVKSGTLREAITAAIEAKP